MITIIAEDRHRIGRARLLRRQGKTYAEIRAVVGPVDDKTLLKWLRGIPRPPETYRSNAQRDLARECRRLRSSGLTHTEIIERTGASVGSVSLWLRGVAVPSRVEEWRRDHLRALRSKAGAALHVAAEQRRLGRVAEASASITEVTERDLFMIGVALYWAEGAKDKPWRRAGCVKFTNSDVTINRVFLAWLDLVGVPREARRFRLSIHESAAVEANERWWSDALDLAPVRFERATLKRHNPKTSRYNRNETYHGCLTITISNPMVLYDAIDGWWTGICAMLRPASAVDTT